MKICQMCEEKPAQFVIMFTEEDWEACPECVRNSFDNEPENIKGVVRIEEE